MSNVHRLIIILLKLKYHKIFNLISLHKFICSLWFYGFINVDKNVLVNIGKSLF